MKRRKRRRVVKKQTGEEQRVRQGTQNPDPIIKTLNFGKGRIINYEKGTIKKKCIEAVNFPNSEAVAHDNNFTFTCISLTIQALLEKGMANHFRILALRTPSTVRKGKKIGH